jgi:hypothetical protein
MYLAMTAWIKKVDCVVLQRSQLLPFLGLERMKNVRVDCLQTDLRSLFPYYDTLVESKTGNYATLYLSRVPFLEGCFRGHVSDENRIKILNTAGLDAAIVEIPAEREMVANLANAIHGVKAFSPGVRKVAVN